MGTPDDFTNMEEFLEEEDLEPDDEPSSESESSTEGKEDTSSGSDSDEIPFVHLHVHSHFSLLDGAGKIDALISRAKVLGMKALALTDHGNIYGMLEFYQKALDAGIKPVLGMEAYMAGGSRFDKGGSGGRSPTYHLTLLAMDMTGYHNLIELSTQAYVEGLYNKRARIDHSLLEQYQEGLICLSGCLSGEISRTILDGDGNNEAMKKARDLAIWYKNLFGDRFYMELQDHGIDQQMIVLQKEIELAKELDIPTVVTNDVHYVLKEDYEIQDLLLCVNTGAFVTDKNRFRMDSQEFYLKSGREMLAAIPQGEDAIRRSVEIADRCHVEPVLGKRFFPRFEPPDNKSSEDYLRELCLNGLKERYANNPKRMVNGELSKEVMDRLNRELYVINKLGFPNYFLIVWDFVRFATEHGIHCSARGSGVGALVCYGLNLSHVCPLEYDLLFERFLDENRLEAPDIDIDFDQEFRGRVLDYVKEKYGEKNVAQIGTFGTLGAKLAIKDLGRVLGLPLPQVNELTAMIPNAPKMTIAKARAGNDKLEAKINTNSDVKKLVDYAVRMEGLVKSAGTHACAVVIADRPVTEFVPLQLLKDSPDLVTQWQAAEVEKAGLLKMDFLGLRNLTILANAISLIEETRHEKINPYIFPTDDKETFALLCRGETKGIFQLESSGIRDLLVRMKPDHFRDIIATLALYRPGPLEGGMVDLYVDIKHGRKEPSYPHQVMKDVLEETHGIMIYQEQVMRIVNRLGNIPLSHAYACIKAISKKKHEKIAKYREDFIIGAQQNSLTKAEAENIFELIISFAGYGFNKSHSTAYALLAYMTAYLKAHYPAEFMAALLNGDISKRNFAKRDSTVEHMDDCEQMHLEVVSPNVNVSYGEYRVRDNKVLFGLMAIKGVGTDAAAEIVRARENGGPFKDIFDFYSRINSKLVPKATVESLLKAGAMDCFGVKRSQLLQVLDKALKSSLNAQEDRQKGQRSLFELLDNEDEDISSAEMMSNAVIGLPEIDEWNDQEKAGYEKEVLGFYLTAHPMTMYKARFRTITSHTISELSKLSDRTNVIAGGMISPASVKTAPTKKKREGEPNIYASFDLEDTDTSIHVMLWPVQYETWGRNVKAESMVVIIGHLDNKMGGEGEVNSTLIADKVFTLEEAEQQLTRGVRIGIKEDKDSQNNVEVLYDILKTYRTDKNGAELEISILFQNGRIGLLHCPKFYIKINDEMKRRVTERFGDNAFRLLALPFHPDPPPERKWPRKE